MTTEQRDGTTPLRELAFRFASWNVNSRKPQPSHVEFLRAYNIDVLALQEATTSFHAGLASASLFSWAESSLLHRPPSPSDGKGRTLGCSLFGRSAFHVAQSGLIDGVPLPERTLVVGLNSPVGALTVCSFHAPPGVTWGPDKPRQLKRIAQWLATRKGRVVLGMDANAPKTDHPDIAQNEWWWDDEPLLLGARPLHTLKDVYRLHVASHPDLERTIRTDRPTGPLALSHIRGRGGIHKPTPCRYDFIYATPDVRIQGVEYLHDASVLAGSDHAMVIADLQIA